MVQGQGGRLPSGERRYAADLRLTPVDLQPGGPSDEATLSLNEFAPGFLLDGRYSVIEQVGIGGMSVVYKARHLLMDRLVAIKTLHHHLMTDAKNLERFLQEAKAEGAINHPNVVGVQSVGLSPGGQLYIVMDYIDGSPLSAVLERGPLAEEQAIEVFRQICDGMEAAHERGIVHRDLKPSNIMLSGPAESPVVRIVDFGIAKLLGSQQSGRRTLTNQGAVIGTPSYMSPEQCRGETLDARSDIYALGCILYETVSGQRAFEGETEFNVLLRQMQDDPVPFDQLANAPVIDKRLQAIIFQSLQKDARLRQASVGILREQLLDRSQVSEIAPSRRSQKAPAGLHKAPGSVKNSHHPRMLQLLLLTVVGLSLSLLILFGRPIMHSIKYKLALMQARAAVDSTERQGIYSSPHVLAQLQLADLEWRNGDTSKALAQYNLVQPSLAGVRDGAADMAVDAVNRLFADRLARANKYMALVDRSEKAGSFRNALAFAQANFKNCTGLGGWPEQSSRAVLQQCYIDYARLLWKNKNFDEGFAAAQRAIALMQSDSALPLEQRQEKICSELNECGQQLIAANRFVEAIQCFQKALRLVPASSERLPAIWEGLGDTYYHQNRFYEAKDAFNTAKRWFAAAPETNQAKVAMLNKKLLAVDISLRDHRSYH